MAENLKIQVIMGSVRQKRNGEKVLSWFRKYVSGRKDAAYEFIDLKDWDLPIFSEATSPAYATKYANKMQLKWSEKIKEGDAFIIITPEYNHGYSSALKNALDYLYREWNSKPVAFVSYGGVSGGIRAVEQLRDVVIELQMIPIRNELNFQYVWEAFDEKGEPKNREMAEQKANALIEQLLINAKMHKKARTNEL